MNYLCLSRDVPSYPSVKHVGVAGYITNHMGAIKSVPTYCKHMGNPLVEGDQWKALCRVHGVANSLETVPRFHETNSGFVFEGKNDAQEILPSLTNYIEFGSSVTRGDFTAQMWLENTVDLEHVAYAHPESFAPILDTRLAQVELLPGGFSRAVVPVKPGAIDGLRRLFAISSAYFSHMLVADNLSVTNFCFAFISVERIQEGQAHTRFFAHKDIKDERFLSLVLRGNKRILAEDAAMLSHFDRDSYKNGQLKNTDTRLAWYRKHANLERNEQET